MLEAWQLGMIDEAGYNGIREEHLAKVAASILSTGLKDIDQNIFESHCQMCGIAPNNFTQEELARLEEKLNE